MMLKHIYKMSTDFRVAVSQLSPIHAQCRFMMCGVTKCSLLCDCIREVMRCTFFCFDEANLTNTYVNDSCLRNGVGSPCVYGKKYGNNNVVKIKMNKCSYINVDIFHVFFFYSQINIDKIEVFIFRKTR